MFSTRYLGLIHGMLLALMGVTLSAAEPAANPSNSAAPSEAANLPIPSAEAPRKMTLPEGFQVSLFASEPDVRQPIAFTIDPRGRLWVAESFSYPYWLQAATEPDRIIILEDSNNDGKYDKRTIFWDRGGKVSNISGLAYGFGGVWICATPNLLFVPDRDHDDKPDGEPEIVLDGWDVKGQHNIFNGLNWGPDGWLYGLNGILSNSNVGKPGTPDAQRVPINCGVWRLHPTRKIFEAVAHGTTNPWGLDFDDYGEAFITNCVIPHLFRVIPGAHFQRMFGPDMMPHSYGLLETCADHIHWAGGHWTDSRGGKGKHGETGGGHAHVGAMVYLGDNWPDRYRNSVFTCNIHGHRINHDSLEPSGSSYVAKHEKDFLFANDDWFRGLELKYGPDGSVFLTDWSDTGECHETDADLSHRENGRIYKISYGTPKPVKVDLESLPDDELVKLQLHKNDWYDRNARRILQERTVAGKDMAVAHKALWSILETNPETTRKLRALWALYVTNGLNEESLAKLLANADAHVRYWSIRLLVDLSTPSASTLATFAKLAKDDPSPLVRLGLAVALQRIALEARWPIAQALLAHEEDTRDSYLPLMDWYGTEALVPTDKARSVSLLAGTKIPVVRQYVARRLVLADDQPASVNAKDTSKGLDLLLQLLVNQEDSSVQSDVLGGIFDALRGRKGLPVPSTWGQVFAKLAKSPDKKVRDQTILLALLFDDPQAIALLKSTVEDRKTPAEERRNALAALVEKRVAGLAPMLQALIVDKDVRGVALKGLASYDEASTPELILKHLPEFDSTDRADAVNTLASRSTFAKALIDGLAKGTLTRQDMNASIARQIHAFNDKALSASLEKLWGAVRPTSQEKATLIAKYKNLLTPDQLKGSDGSRGREVFNRSCAQCHKLFDAGGNVGPELTGSDRGNVDYLLENILDPSATVGRDFKLTLVSTNDGRLISGIIREQTDKTLVIQTVNERLLIPREEIEEMKGSDASMMPEGALETLTSQEIRDLITYLTGKTQVPIAK
ncbi:PVC-type heme-binding CxxCH protein [Singulisphaera sp. PoT]|uniref:PVC-type heme-binding CxxCH protein n=1 Tax=Singulisphaera sp. PoT TaxID=3411797 RepID=UPI003BF4941F